LIFTAGCGCTSVPEAVAVAVVVVANWVAEARFLLVTTIAAIMMAITAIPAVV